MSTVRFISGSPRPRVLQLRELQQHVGHLVAALAAADVDDDLGVGPLGQLVLDDGLARAERAGHAGGPALGDREEGVDDALAGDERLVGTEAFADRAGPGGPASAASCVSVRLPALDLEFADRRPRPCSCRSRAFVIFAVDTGRHHDLVHDQRGLLHLPRMSPPTTSSPTLAVAVNSHFLVSVEAGHVDAARDVVRPPSPGSRRADAGCRRRWTR